MDVTIESGGAAASRFASYTTSKDTATTSKTEEDIPEWKKAMLERRRKDRVTNRSFGTIKFRINFSSTLPTITYNSVLCRDDHIELYQNRYSF